MEMTFLTSEKSLAFELKRVVQDNHRDLTHDHTHLFVYIEEPHFDCISSRSQGLEEFYLAGCSYPVFSSVFGFSNSFYSFIRYSPSADQVGQYLIVEFLGIAAHLLASSLIQCVTDSCANMHTPGPPSQLYIQECIMIPVPFFLPRIIHV